MILDGSGFISSGMLPPLNLIENSLILSHFYEPSSQSTKPKSLAYLKISMVGDTKSTTKVWKVHVGPPKLYS